MYTLLSPIHNGLSVLVCEMEEFIKQTAIDTVRPLLMNNVSCTLCSFRRYFSPFVYVKIDQFPFLFVCVGWDLKTRLPLFWNFWNLVMSGNLAKVGEKLDKKGPISGTSQGNVREFV